MTAIQRPDTLADRLAAVERRLRAVEAVGSVRAVVPAVTADPSPLAKGMVWVRSDLDKLCWTKDGATVTRVP